MATPKLPTKISFLSLQSGKIISGGSGTATGRWTKMKKRISHKRSCYATRTGKMRWAPDVAREGDYGWAVSGAQASILLRVMPSTRERTAIWLWAMGILGGYTQYVQSSYVGG
jgi:hypothetical protein